MDRTSPNPEALKEFYEEAFGWGIKKGEVPGQGRFAVFLDTEGNAFDLWQSTKE
ncbi:MAG: hypothetical protein ACE5IB_05750 [Candidatus Geothermarchaeales archaeon]